MVDFYKKVPTTSANSFGTPSITDIDLREEMRKFLWDEARGIYVLYRKVQFEDGFPKKCECWDVNTLEPDIDTSCRLCRGLGYFFNDHIVRGWKSLSQGFSSTRRHKDQGVDQVEYKAFYFEYDVIASQTGDSFDIPTTYDKIIEIETDINGLVLSPLRQRVKYDIISVDPYRLEEGGRMEFYRIRVQASLEGSYLV